MKFEGFNKREIYSLDDHEDKAYFPFLSKLPKELAEKHIAAIEERNMDEQSALVYLESILDKRKEAITETHISDTILQTLVSGKEHAFTHEVETSIYKSPNIGEGQTAKVKRHGIASGGEDFTMAIKYLVTPTAKTLSAAAEHDMLREVERIETIEHIEEEAHLRFIRVPHPYFHHKRERLQCYGMQLINGANLREVIEKKIGGEVIESFRTAFQNLNLEEIYREIEVFCERMHKYCLHGDVKPANIMVDTAGTFYVIDFGQSVLVNDIPEEGREQLDNLKDDEISRMKLAVKEFFKTIRPKFPAVT